MQKGLKTFKNLFFVDAGENSDTTEKENAATEVQTEVAETNDFLDETLVQYEEGFAKLNIPGLDFYEFCQAVSKLDANDPKTFNIVQVTLGVPKEILLENAALYVKNILALHAQHETAIKQKADTLINARSKESEGLNTQIASTKTQIQQLQQQLQKAEEDLKVVHQKYMADEQHLQKLTHANDYAKNTIVGRISTVAEGIEKHLK